MHRGDTGKSGVFGIRSGHLMRRYEQKEKEEKEEESFTSERDSRPLNCFMTLESVMPCDTTVLS